jgi:hypothetical protein
MQYPELLVKLCGIFVKTASKCEFAVKVTLFVSSDEMLKALLQTKRIGHTKEAIWKMYSCLYHQFAHAHP